MSYFNSLIKVVKNTPDTDATGYVYEGERDRCRFELYIEITSIVESLFRDCERIEDMNQVLYDLDDAIGLIREEDGPFYDRFHARIATYIDESPFDYLLDESKCREIEPAYNIEIS